MWRSLLIAQLSLSLAAFTTPRANADALISEDFTVGPGCLANLDADVFSVSDWCPHRRNHRNTGRCNSPPGGREYRHALCGTNVPGDFVLDVDVQVANRRQFRAGVVYGWTAPHRYYIFHFNDLRLLVGSPAIDDEDNDALAFDDLDLDDDADFSERIPIDLDGNERRVDDPSVERDPGNAALAGFPVVDVGALEFQAPIFVDASALGANDGTTWTNAYNSLQDALSDPRVTGGTISQIWVADGTYMPDGGYIPVDGVHVPGTGLRPATFQLLTGLGFYGGFAGFESTLDERVGLFDQTILTGDLFDDDAPVRCTNDSPDCDSFGGACYFGSCFVRPGSEENSYFVVVNIEVDSTAVLDGFVIRDGTPDTVNGISGGGMLNLGSSPTITNCTFVANTGSGMLNGQGTPIVTNCIFDYNVGGGMANALANAIVTNCTFRRNLIWGLVNYSSSPKVTNCIFTGNFSSGIANTNGGPDDPDIPDGPFVINSTFSENGEYAIVNIRSNATLTNCVLWGDGVGEILNFYGTETPTVSYSDVQGGLPRGTIDGGGNIDADPLFVPGPGGSYYLSQISAGDTVDSPCVDEGSDTAANLGLDTMTTRSDAIMDTGIVDMGYHYHPGTGPQDFMGDYNRDGNVDLADFSAFQNCFSGEGPTDVSPCCRIFDFEPDRDVDLEDYASFYPAFNDLFQSK